MGAALTADPCLGCLMRTSAEMAVRIGCLPRYKRNADHMLRVHPQPPHRRAGQVDGYEALTLNLCRWTKPGCPDQAACPYGDWLPGTRRCALVNNHGYRNAQVSVIRADGPIGLVMGLRTTGIEPDFCAGEV